MVVFDKLLGRLTKLHGSVQCALQLWPVHVELAGLCMLPASSNALQKIWQKAGTGWLQGC